MNYFIYKCAFLWYNITTERDTNQLNPPPPYIMKTLITLTTIVGGSIFTTFNAEDTASQVQNEIFTPIEISKPILVKPKRIYAVLVKPTIKRYTIEDFERDEAERNENEAWDKMVEGVKFFEGFKPKAYKCAAGVTTIGYGHTGKYAKVKKIVSEMEAEEMLMDELMEARSHVERIVKVPLTKAQMAALTSFTFNAGQGNLRMLVNQPGRLNSGNYESVEKMLPKYNKGGGRTLKGLTKRRNWETSLWASN